MHINRGLLPVLAAVCTVSGAMPAAAGEDEALRERLEASLQRLAPGVEVTAVRPAPAGLVEVTLGSRVMYMTSDGRYLINGDLMDVAERRNLTDERRAATRVAAFSRLGPEDYIEFAPEHVERTLYVFTDVDCAYCRRFHQQVAELNAAGIAVRYLAFPRAGLGSRTYRTMVSVWCANDRRQALTAAKAGQPLPEGQCDSPVAREYRLGQEIGVQGTPSVYLDTGEELGGYIPAPRLIRMLTGARS